LLGDDGWVQAEEALVGRRSEVKTMTVYNLHVITRKEEDRHYCLVNWRVAHNKILILERKYATLLRSTVNCVLRIPVWMRSGRTALPSSYECVSLRGLG